MLILTRKIHESIMIGKNVRIEVIDIDEQSVRLGIEAPRIIPVYRQELYQRIQRENYIKKKYVNISYSKPFYPQEKIIHIS